MFRRFHRRNAAALLPVVVACIAGTSAYAFTASNTLPTTAQAKAGSGSVAVDGYTISSLSYTFVSGTQSVKEVDFDLDSSASDVEVALVNGTPQATDWLDCHASGSTSPFAVTCLFSTPIANGNAATLYVIAVGSGTITITN